jgi:hypothetical protein
MSEALHRPQFRRWLSPEKSATKEVSKVVVSSFFSLVIEETTIAVMAAKESGGYLLLASRFL